MSGRRHRDESGKDEGSHDFGSLCLTCMLPIKTSLQRSGIALIAVFSFLALIAVRRGSEVEVSRLPFRLCSCVLPLNARRRFVLNRGSATALRAANLPVRERLR